jgi:tetratricopeptide (TPR) repeat protein
VVQKNDVCSRIALCYKKLGQYETALGYLKEVNTATPGLSPILAEMADCYALCGEERTAKMLFREAFFIDAAKIDLSFLDSEMIRSLIDLVASKGFYGRLLPEWVPVYGTLYGVFTVHRQLLALEAGKLKQAIFALEMAMKEGDSDHELLLPRLINHCFWLINHLRVQQEDRKKIEEVLMKIHLLDEDIYTQYTGIEGVRNG